MFYLINNTLTNSFGVNDKADLNLNSQQNDAGLDNAAHQLTQTASGDFFAVNTYNLDISSQTVTIAVAFIAITDVDSFSLDIIDGASATAHSQVFSVDIISKEFRRYVASFEVNSIGTPVQFLLNIENRDLTTSDQIDFADFYIQIGSDNNLPVLPEYSFSESDKKFEERHRVRSGREYVYKWSDYKVLKMGIKFVDSNFKSITNSWWANNSDLLWVESGSVRVESMHLINKKLPIGMTMKPYTDLFTGTIDLGTY